MKTLRMIAMGLMALVCVTGLVACGSDDDDPTTPSTPSKPSTDPTTPSQEKPTSLTVTYHLLVSESVYKYASVQVLDGSNKVVKTLTAADFKACTSTDMIPESYDRLKMWVDTYLSDGNTTYYDYSFETTYTTFPFSDAYKLKATPAADMTGAPTKSDFLKNCQYVTYTGKGSFKVAAESGTYSVQKGVTMAKWSDFLKSINVTSVSISCDANGAITLK